MLNFYNIIFGCVVCYVVLTLSNLLSSFVNALTPTVAICVQL